MKRLLSIGVVLFALVFSSCDDLLEITLDSKDIELDFVIEPTQQTGQIAFCNETFQNDLDSLLEANNASWENIKSINLKSVIIANTNLEASGVFNPISSVWATLKADDLDEVIVASLTNMTQGVDTVTLNVVGDDILQYLSFDQFQIKINGVINQAITETIYAQATIKYTVTVGIVDSEEE